MLITGIRLDGLHREGGKVAGVVADRDVVKADVVVAADGAMSQIARSAGLLGRARALFPPRLGSSSAEDIQHG